MKKLPKKWKILKLKKSSCRSEEAATASEAASHAKAVVKAEGERKVAEAQSIEEE